MWPKMTLVTSVACRLAMTPATAPRVPTSEQLGTSSASGVSSISSVDRGAGQVCHDISRPSQDTAVGVGDALDNAGVVDEVFGGKVIAAVEDHVVFFDELSGIDWEKRARMARI